MMRLGGLNIILLATMALFAACNKVKVEDIPVQLDLQDDAYTTAPETAVELDILANDIIKGEQISVNLSTPSHGTLEAIEGTTSFIYTPEKGFTDTEELSYEVCAGDRCETAAISITVDKYIGCTPNLIVRRDHITSKSLNIEIPISGLLENDIVQCDDIIDQSFKITDGLAEGKIVIKDGLISIAMVNNDWVNDEFEYEVCTVNGLCGKAKVVLINQDADVPTLQ